MTDTPLVCHECWPQRSAWSGPCPHTNQILRHFEQKLDTMTQARVGDIKEIERLIRERGILAGERDGYRLQAECMTRERDGFCEAFKASEKERHDALLQKEEMGRHAAALRTALLKFGQHTEACWGQQSMVDKTCRCGLTAALEAIPSDYTEKRACSCAETKLKGGELAKCPVCES